MEVTIVTAHLSENSGGFARSIPGMKRALARFDNIHVSVVGLRDLQRPDAWRAWGDCVHAVEPIGPRAFGWAPGMVGAIVAKNPDIVDAQGLWMYPSIAALAWHRRSRRPYVVTPRGMLDPWGLSTARVKKQAALFLFERAHLSKAACLRATSELEAGNFRRLGLRNPVAVVPNGIDLPALLPRDHNPQCPRRVLFLSRMHPKKGIGVLLKAWARLQERFSDWELLIVGPDEKGHKPEMKELSASLGLRGVSWHDAVDDAEKHRLYRSADLFVLPTMAENFGLVIAEALANEVAVITTRNAPWEGLVHQGCGWWIDLTEHNLAEAMAQAMALPSAKLHKMGERGRAWVAREYSWGAIGEKLCALYCWVARAGARPDFLID